MFTSNSLFYITFEFGLLCEAWVRSVIPSILALNSFLKCLFHALKICWLMSHFKPVNLTTQRS